MTDTATEVPGTDGDAPKKGGKKGLLIGLVLAILGGAGSFFAFYSGMVGGSGDPAAEEAAHAAEEEEQVFELPDVAYVPVGNMVISLGSAEEARHLRFSASLEVPTRHQEAVTMILPRITDVLNSYLRAVRMEDLDDPTALVRLRAQMLRRIQVITGPDMVRDLLIIEFVMN